MTKTITNSTLQLPEVQTVLEQLHDLADVNDKTIIQQILSSGYDWKAASSKQNAATFREALLPISPDVGRFLYAIARSISAERIVEFGTSYGISTIYLAAAVRDRNGGIVIGSEMESSKVTHATENLATAGLLPFVEIRAGDALETLRDPGGTIDVLFLDGWKNLYLDVLQLVSHNLRSGAVILADDLEIAPDQLAPYLDYIRNPENGFISVTLPIDDGIEYSVKL